MSNWVRISNEELKKSKEIIELKKGELQIELVKALVKIDKAIEEIDELQQAIFGLEDKMWIYDALQKIADRLKGE